MVLDKRIDTIDVTKVQTMPVSAQVEPYSPAAAALTRLLLESCRAGHSYITRNIHVLNDLHALVMFDSDPDRRILLQQREARGVKYWDMRRVSQ